MIESSGDKSVGPAVTASNYLDAVISQITSANKNSLSKRGISYTYHQSAYGWILVDDNPQMTMNGLTSDSEIAKYGGIRIGTDYLDRNEYLLPVPVDDQQTEIPNIPTEPLVKLSVIFSYSLDEVGVELDKIRLAIKKSSGATRNLTKCKLDDQHSNILIMYDPRKYDPNSKDGELDA